MAIGTLAFVGTARSTTTYIYQPTITVIKKPRPVQQNYSVEFLKDFVGEVSIKQQLDTQDYNDIVATIQCESSFFADPPHNNISWGVAQFTPVTWHDFGHGDIMNPISQIEVMVSMWNKWEMHKGTPRQMKNRWDCYRLGLYKKYEK